MVSEKFKEIAKLELREDEQRKQQALAHFREWLNKHPYIRKVRQGKRVDLNKFRMMKSNEISPTQTMSFCFNSYARKSSAWIASSPPLKIASWQSENTQNGSIGLKEITRR